MAEYTLLVLGIYLAGCSFLAWETVRPKLSKHRVTPANYKIEFEHVSLRSADGTRLAGWFMPAPLHAKGVVILCHGVDSAMNNMLWKAAALRKKGISTLVFDFRGRGESDGALCTIGFRETDDLAAAVDYLKGRPDTKALPLGVFGESQGGAVALMGAARKPEIRAVVAESPFSRLDRAVDNHFSSVFGRAGATALTPVRWIGEAMIRRRCCDVSPLDEIAKISPRPILLIQDGDDALCPPSETAALMQAAGEPKELWTVPGADHVQCELVDPDGFNKRVPAFFLKHLTRRIAE